MSKYKITVTDTVTYYVEADSDGEAIDMALEWWAERDPLIEMKEEE